MAVSEGIHGHGTTISGSTSGAIAFVTNINIDGIDVDPLDISTLESPNKWREYIGGMKEPGELGMDLVYDKDVASVLLTALGTSQVWTITFPDSSTWVVSGFLRSMSTPVSFEEAITQSVGIKADGAPVFTEGSV